MDKLMEWIAKINSAINGVVWGLPMIILILGTGIFLTVRTRALQVRKFGTSFKETIGATFQEMGRKKGKNGIENKRAISPFEAFSTAISGTQTEFKSGVYKRTSDVSLTAVWSENLEDDYWWGVVI